MYKNLKKISLLLIISILAIGCSSCKKKKTNWIEVGSDPNPPKIAPGVHPERGSDSNATPVISAAIYIPLGMDRNAMPQYKKFFYDLEELTPENVDLALKARGVIGESSLFCDLLLEDVPAEDRIPAGPGAVGQLLTKKGTVRYVSIEESPLDNSEEYEGKTYQRDLEGMIGPKDVVYCIEKTFEENFHLVSCKFDLVDNDVYKQIHGTK